MSQIIIKPNANSVRSAIVTKSGKRGSEMKTYEAGLKKLKETLDCVKLQYLSPELRRANLDYAEGIAFVLDIGIYYEKMEVIEK